MCHGSVGHEGAKVAWMSLILPYIASLSMTLTIQGHVKTRVQPLEDLGRSLLGCASYAHACHRNVACQADKAQGHDRSNGGGQEPAAVPDTGQPPH
eukprot:scaffold57786_cov21-Tisochrysis_lutea.AAC.2